MWANLTLFLVIVVGTVYLGCEPGRSVNDNARSTELDIPTTGEDELITRCSPLLFDQVNNKAEEEQNQLVNYIIDQKWDLYFTGGIFHHIIDGGEETKATWGTQVLVHYIGYNLEGHIFDSSVQRDQPFKFYVGNVIEGWNQALPLLGKGGKGFFLIPAHLAYGHEGFKDLVPPDQHLIFYIELIEILK